MSAPGGPEPGREPVAVTIPALAVRIGRNRFVAVCTDLMTGGAREDHVEELRSLTGHAWRPGDPVLDPGSWGDHWLRAWGARGLLHVWDDSATDVVVAGLDDEHWRPAEMCLKVVTAHEVAGAGDAVARLAGSDRARVRAQAMRALAVVGDVEHVVVVRRGLEDPDPAVRRQAARALRSMTHRLDLPAAGSGLVSGPEPA